MGLAILLALALAGASQTDPGASASEPQGPPASAPLQRQTGLAGPGPGGARPTVAGQTASTVVAPLPVAGQPASGLISYPASFFAASGPNTARDMINRVPGFVFDDGATVRGFEGAAGNVLIDGQLPTSKSDDLDSVLRRIPASQVDHIDLIRGGAPGIDMHGKVLVADVVRRSGPSSTAVVSASNQWLTSDGRQGPAIRLEGTHRADGTSLEGSLTLARYFDDGAGDGVVVQTGPDGLLQGGARDNTKAGGYQAGATGAYERSLAGGKFRINASVQYQPYFNDEIVGLQGGTEIAPSLEHDHQNTEQGELGLHYSRDFGSMWSLEALAIQQVNGEDSLTLYDTPGEDDRFREQHTNGETIGRGVATWRPSQTLALEAGVETAYNWLDSHVNYTSDAATVSIPAADETVRELRGEVFGKGTWAPSSKLTLELGLRMEVSHITASGDEAVGKTLEYPKPRLAVTWSPDRADQIRLRLEREVGQLDFNDFVATASLSTGHILAGNPNLTPQQAWVVEAAYERSFLKDGAATLTVRHSDLSDVIDRAAIFSQSETYDAPANIGGGDKDELIGDVSLPLQRFGLAGGLLKANLTWRRSRVSDPTTGEERPISGLKPFEGKVDFSQDLPRWRLTLGGELNVGWSQRYFRYDQIETDRLSRVGQLYAEVRPKPGWSVRGELDDIGIGFDRTLANWADVRGRGVAYANLDFRSLTLGPIAYLRVRRNW